MKKTIVYVDGFNLYYGSLRKTPYKWLDLNLLFNKILGEHNTIIEIKYFTARISSRVDNNVLSNSQLPNPIPGTNLYKPGKWQIQNNIQ